MKINYEDVVKKVHSQDGYFNLEGIISENDYFNILYEDEEILFLNIKKIRDACENISLLNISTCLQVDRDENEVLYPINKTTSFNSSDKYIVVFIELENIEHDCPINITLFKDNMILYSFMDIIPASNDFFNKFHKTYAHGIKLDCNDLLQEDFINVLLSITKLTGEVIHSQKIVINSIEANNKKIQNRYRHLKSSKNGLNFDIKL